MSTVKRTFELDVGTEATLEKLASDQGRTPSEVIAEAVAAYAIGSDWIEDDRRWAEYLATGESYGHDEVEAWLETVGTPEYRSFDDFRAGLKRS